MVRRLILGALAAVLLLILAAAALAYWFVSGDGVRLALEQQASSWLNQPVRIESAAAQFFPRIGIDLTGVRVGEPARLILNTVELSTDFRALLRRQIEAADIRVASSRIEMPLPFELPASRDAGPDDASRGSLPIQVLAIRSIALSEITIASRGREVVIAAESSLSGPRLQLTQLTARSGRTALEADGVVELEPAVDARLRVRADRLDLDELMAIADAFTPAAPASAPRATRTSGRIAARVSAERATAGGIDVTQLASEMELEGDRLALSPLTFQLLGGRYQGSMTATLGDSVSATLRSRILDIDVAQLSALGGVPDAVTGRLTGAATFSGEGVDLAAVLRTARGTGTAEVVDGRIRGLDLVRTVVLFFGRPAPDASPGSDRFDRLDVRFSVSGQTFRADAFALQSTDADIVGQGTLVVPTGRLDGTLDLSLSEALSAQAGTDLYRYTREGKRVVLPARLGGTLGAPRLTIDAEAALKRGLRNEVQRRLRGLLDR